METLFQLDNIQNSTWPWSLPKSVNNRESPAAASGRTNGWDERHLRWPTQRRNGLSRHRRDLVWMLPRRLFPSCFSSWDPPWSTSTHPLQRTGIGLLQAPLLREGISGVPSLVLILIRWELSSLHAIISVLATPTGTVTKPQPKLQKVP